MNNHSSPEKSAEKINATSADFGPVAYVYDAMGSYCAAKNRTAERSIEVSVPLNTVTAPSAPI